MFIFHFCSRVTSQPLIGSTSVAPRDRPRVGAGHVPQQQQQQKQTTTTAARARTQQQQPPPAPPQQQKNTIQRSSDVTAQPRQASEAPNIATAPTQTATTNLLHLDASNLLAQSVMTSSGMTAGQQLWNQPTPPSAPVASGYAQFNAQQQHPVVNMQNFAVTQHPATNQVRTPHPLPRSPQLPFLPALLSYNSPLQLTACR